jgi:hypothetical protein
MIGRGQYSVPARLSTYRHTSMRAE